MKFPEQYRYLDAPFGYHTNLGDRYGVFDVPAKKAMKRKLHIIADDGKETGWEHVSVSLTDFPKLCPSWDEMCLVKDLFWDAEECVIQYHPSVKDYVNVHQGVLHLWRPTAHVCLQFPTPPKRCV